MDEAKIRRQLLARYGLRIDPEMGKYVFRHLSDAARSAAAADAATIPIIGVDARTGVAVRQFVDLNTLQAPAAS